MSNYPSLTFHATLRSSRAGNVAMGMSATNNKIALDTGTVVTGAGTYMHDQLRNRDIENQHPVSAITGLASHLATLDSDSERMSGDINSLALTAGQLATRMSSAEGSIANKVDKETGKGLSSNDFTDELKEKLEAVDPSTSGLPSGGHSGDVLICSGGDQGVWRAPATSVQQDNTLPITSAAVYTEIGNINALLETI